MPELTRTQKTFLKVKEGKLFKVVNKEEVEIFAYMGKLKSIVYAERDVKYDNATVHIQVYEVSFYDEKCTWVWSADSSSYTTLFFLNGLLAVKDLHQDIIFRPYLNKNKKTNIALEEDIKLIGGEYKGTLVKGKYDGEDIPHREPIIVKGKQYEIKGVPQWDWKPIENFNARLVEEIQERLGSESGHRNGLVTDFDDVGDDNDAEIDEIFGGAQKA